jgi:hypothetical protein
MTALPRPLNQRGPVKERQRQHHELSRKLVFLRCKGWCEAPGCHAQATDWAHLAGRRHIVSEPYASSPELTAGLCRDHHNAIDRGLDPVLLDTLRWFAVQRLALRYRLAIATPPADPLDVIRQMVATVSAE